MILRSLPSWAPTDLTGLTADEVKRRLLRIERELRLCAREKRRTAAAAKRHAVVSEYLIRVAPLAAACRVELATRRGEP